MLSLLYLHHLGSGGGRAYAPARACSPGDRASQLLKEAADIYKIVPGVQHPFYNDDFLPLLRAIEISY